jgi:hypothetical protein
VNRSGASYTTDPKWIATYLVISMLMLLGFVAVPAWRMSHHIAQVIDSRVQVYQHRPAASDHR